MLLLTRKVGEAIKIGNDVTVIVVGIKGRAIRIGIAAPDDVLVDRAEVRDQREQQAAAATK